MPRQLPCLLLLPLLALPLSASAAGAGCLPQWHDGWIRRPPMAMPMMAGFGRLSNPCPAAVAVVSASSPLFEEVGLHESAMVGGVNRMREVESLPLGPGREVRLQPGGLHLMLMRPKSELHDGDRVPLKLKLADGRVLEAHLRVATTAP